MFLIRVYENNTNSCFNNGDNADDCSICCNYNYGYFYGSQYNDNSCDFNFNHCDKHNNCSFYRSNNN